MQLGLSHTLDPEEAATNYGLLFSTKQIAQGQSQAASDIDLHRSPSQEAPEATHPVAGFRPHRAGPKLAPQEENSKGDINRPQTPLQ